MKKKILKNVKEFKPRLRRPMGSISREARYTQGERDYLLRAIFFANKSFTLIELLIYLAVFSFFSILVFNFFSDTQQKIFFDIGKNEKLIKKTIASDLLKRDLMCASEKTSDWFLGEQNIVFKKMSIGVKGNQINSCIGWQIFQKTVSRIEGEFDFLLHKWRKKTNSKVGYDFGALSSYLNKSKDGMLVKSVEFSFGDDYVQFVKLRNGEYCPQAYPSTSSG